MDKEGYNQHISQQFNEELEDVKGQLLEMGGLVEKHISDAVTSILDGNSELAEKVIKQDKTINQLEVDINEECVQILAKRQPAASDLRLVLSIIRAATDLERIGDEAGKVAAQAVELSEAGPAPGGYGEIRHMGSSVRGMLRDALDAFARLDARQALDVVQQDSQVDNYYGSGMRVLLSLMMEDPRAVSRLLNVMWALRSLERIGDHAANIAEHVIFMVKAEDVRHLSVKKMVKRIKKLDD